MGCLTHASWFVFDLFRNGKLVKLLQQVCIELVTLVILHVLSIFRRNPSVPVREDLGGDWPEFTTENEAYLSLSKSPSVVTDLGPYRDRAALWLQLLPELAALTPQSAGGATEEASHTATGKDEL